MRLKWPHSEHVILMNTGIYGSIPYRSAPKLIVITSFIHKNVAFLKFIPFTLFPCHFDCGYVGQIDMARLNVGNPQIFNA